MTPEPSKGVAGVTPCGASNKGSVGVKVARRVGKRGGGSSTDKTPSHLQQKSRGRKTFEGDVRTGERGGGHSTTICRQNTPRKLDHNSREEESWQILRVNMEKRGRVGRNLREFWRKSLIHRELTLEI